MSGLDARVVEQQGLLEEKDALVASLESDLQQQTRLVQAHLNDLNSVRHEKTLLEAESSKAADRLSLLREESTNTQRVLEEQLKGEEWSQVPMLTSGFQ